MGDRIAIMRDGLLEQVGDPDAVYEQPVNTFVAGFIGSPAMNLSPIGVDRRNGDLRLVLGDVRVDVPEGREVPAEVVLGVRPEHTRLWDGNDDLLGPIEGRVEYVESLGRETLIGARGPGETRFVVETDGRVRPDPGETVTFGLRRGRLYLFDASDGRSLGRL